MEKEARIGESINNKNLGGEKKKKMKTKTKLIASVEIAIVLCSVFLMAIPAIAAEQNMQKASASEASTASKDGYALPIPIYGNANEDDAIDMRDLTYVKLIFFGKKPETELADAKYDGKINPLDFIQIKLIIVGKEKELTILDDYERSVTLKMPLERVVLTRMGHEEALVVIGAADRVVGISSDIPKSRPYICEAGGLMDLPLVGEHPDLDYEKILALNPDLVFSSSHYSYMNAVVEKIGDEVPVVALVVYDQEDIRKAIRGYKTLEVMFDKKEEANKIISWIQKYDCLVKDRTKDLTPEEKPTFYIETYDNWVTYGSDHWDGKVTAGCGGRNIVDRVDFTPGSWGEYVIDPEWLIEQNPDVIFRRVSPRGDLVTEEKAGKRIEKLIDRPGWESINAVKNGRVYIYNSRIVFSAGHVIGSCYFAKCLHPDLFSDLDPMELCDEYWNTFLGIDFPEMPIYPLPS
jgi:iron complex transport system substrate-binding protein